MSGLKILAAVAGVVQAFHAGYELIHQIERRQVAKKRGEPGEDAQVEGLRGLGKSLATGESRVQKEYDDNYAQFGDRFATGDREFHFFVLLCQVLHRQRQAQLKILFIRSCCQCSKRHHDSIADGGYLQPHENAAATRHGCDGRLLESANHIRKRNASRISRNE
jgi:hypothetical protein